MFGRLKKQNSDVINAQKFGDRQHTTRPHLDNKGMLRFNRMTLILLSTMIVIWQGLAWIDETASVATCAGDRRRIRLKVNALM